MGHREKFIGYTPTHLSRQKLGFFKVDSSPCVKAVGTEGARRATGDTPPAKLNCAIDFTPAWKPVVEALRALEKAGRVVINAIRKEETDKETLLKLDYPTHLWLEKELKSVANITRSDARDFLPLAAEIPIIPEIQEFSLEEANRALTLLKQGKIQGAGVLKMPE